MPGLILGLLLPWFVQAQQQYYGAHVSSLALSGAESETDLQALPIHPGDVLTVENLRDATDVELREAFDRLNRNVARLTAQELRHAVFPGVFLERMEALTEAPFWANKRIFSAHPWEGALPRHWRSGIPSRSKASSSSRRS